MEDSNVAVITGGTGALGRAIVPLLIRRRFKIAVSYIIPEEASEFEDEVGFDNDEGILRRVDCTDPDQVRAFMDEVAEAYGTINVLCSLVGAWAGGRDVSETDDVRFDRMIDLNLRSTFYVVRAAIPHMADADWGRIIVVSSRAAIDPPTGQAAFNIAKAGVLSLARSVAVELDHTNVTANALLPSVIDTAATRDALPYADYVHWPKPHEIASVVNFLASPDSEVIDGAAIPVYGQS